METIVKKSGSWMWDLEYKGTKTYVVHIIILSSKIDQHDINLQTICNKGPSINHIRFSKIGYSISKKAFSIGGK